MCPNSISWTRARTSNVLPSLSYHQMCFSCKHCGIGLIVEDALTHNVFIVDGMPYCDICIRKMGTIKFSKFILKCWNLVASGSTGRVQTSGRVHSNPWARGRAPELEGQSPWERFSSWEGFRGIPYWAGFMANVSLTDFLWSGTSSHSQEGWMMLIIILTKCHPFYHVTETNLNLLLNYHLG